MSAAGPDLDRSAAGRVALDAVLVPAAFLSPAVTWRDGLGPDTVTAEWTIGGPQLAAGTAYRAGRRRPLGHHDPLG
jgi:hypothetical protein